MNPLLSKLQPYPFEKWRLLIENIEPPQYLSHISFGIGEPKHATPTFIQDALIKHVDKLSNYPATLGTLGLRQAISTWIMRRYHVETNPEKHIIPVNGSREALFAFTQAVVNSTQPSALVVCPNPFYQIYEGAILLAGAEPYYLNTDADDYFNYHFTSIPDHIWQKVQMIFVCSPNNPTGAVMNLEQWRTLFELSDKYNFIIASDECYSEIYDQDPPLGGLEASKLLGRTFNNLVVFSSLSKRSNVPGLRSGFVAGDEKILELFLLYRTYHGSAMSVSTQMASIAAWMDEEHVIQNRLLYNQKINTLLPLLQQHFEIQKPDASFYFWLKIPEVYGLNDVEFAYELFKQKHVTCLPGSYLAREIYGHNPGKNYLRLALVDNLDACTEGVYRMIDFVQSLKTN
jgi:N-succinyldiaminopimelate aminotransferase